MSASSLGGQRFKPQPSRTKDLKKMEHSASSLNIEYLKGASMYNPHRRASMGRRKFLLSKCPGECSEKSGAIQNGSRFAVGGSVGSIPIWRGAGALLTGWERGYER